MTVTVLIGDDVEPSVVAAQTQQPLLVSAGSTPLLTYPLGGLSIEGGGTGDHSELTNLTADDHPQYLTTSRAATALATTFAPTGDYLTSSEAATAYATAAQGALADTALQPGDQDLGGVWTVTRDQGLAIEWEVAEEVDHTTIKDTWDHFHYIDGVGGFVTGADDVVRFIAPGDGRWGGVTASQNHDPANPYQAILTTPTEGNLFGLPHTDAYVTNVPSNLDWCSGGSAIHCGNGVNFVILHCEDNDARPDAYYWRIDAGRLVIDANGDVESFTDVGILQRHEMTLAEAVSANYSAWNGTAVLLDWSHIDGYVYLSHVDHTSAGEAGFTISRCPKSDIVAAMTDATPYVPPFRKWNGEALTDTWTELCDGGSFQSFGYGTAGATLANNGDAVVLRDGRILITGVEQAGSAPTTSTTSWTEVTDPISLNVPVNVMETTTTRERIYANSWTGSVDSPKLVQRPEVFFHYLDADQSDRWNTNLIRKLTLRPVADVSSLPTTATMSTIAEAAVTGHEAEADPHTVYRKKGTVAALYPAGDPFYGPGSTIPDQEGTFILLPFDVGDPLEYTMPDLSNMSLNDEVVVVVATGFGTGPITLSTATTGQTFAHSEATTGSYDPGTIISFVANGTMWLRTTPSAAGIGIVDEALASSDVQTEMNDVWSRLTALEGSSVTPGGSDTQIQFNDGGSLGGDEGLTFDKTTNKLTLTGRGNESDTTFVVATSGEVSGGGAVQTLQRWETADGTNAGDVREVKTAYASPAVAFRLGLGAAVDDGSRATYLYEQDPDNGRHRFRGPKGNANTSYFDIQQDGGGVTILRQQGNSGTLKLEAATITLEPVTLNLSAGPAIGHANLQLKTSGDTALFIHGSNNRRRVKFGNGVATTDTNVQVAAEASNSADTALRANNTAAPNADIFQVQRQGTTVFAVDKDGQARLKTGTPATSGATGTAGTVVWDADYLYVCVATDTWKRVALESW